MTQDACAQSGGLSAGGNRHRARVRALDLTVTTRANWFLGDLEVASEELIPSGVMVQGQLIDLRDSEPKLRQELHDLFQREKRLFDVGVTCAVRDQPHTCCMACPMFSADESKPLSALCRVGRDSERVVTQLAVALHGDRRDRP